MTIKRAAAAALLALLAGWLTFDAAGAACMSGREGRRLLEQGQVVPFPEAIRQSGIARSEVVDVQLCEGGGGFVYRVKVLNKRGRVRSVNIPAG